MSQIDELQRRISAALDRIGQGIEGLQAGGGDGATDELRQELDNEKTANQQLRERVRALKQKRENAIAEHEKTRQANAETIRRLDTELQSLRKANQQLRDNNQALRQAIADGVTEPHLINKAMLAELDALRASRMAEQTETETILNELIRVIDGADGGRTENAQPEDA